MHFGRGGNRGSETREREREREGERRGEEREKTNPLAFPAPFSFFLPLFPPCSAPSSGRPRRLAAAAQTGALLLAAANSQSRPRTTTNYCTLVPKVCPAALQPQRVTHARALPRTGGARLPLPAVGRSLGSSTTAAASRRAAESRDVTSRPAPARLAASHQRRPLAKEKPYVTRV